MGVPGWILLTHNQENKPVAFFKDSREQLTQIPMVMDERLFSDTILRVVKIGKSEYVVYDIDYLNGQSVFEKWNYQTRIIKLAEILEFFHYPDLSALMLPEDAPYGTTVRGYECYDDQPGSMGVFIPIDV
jgi:hypothetical protein